MPKRLIAALLALLVWTGPVVGAQETRLPGTIAAWPHLQLNRFEVTAGEEQADLGSWSKVDGLDVTFDVIEYRPGGGTLTLHRRAGSDSLLVRDWLAGLAESNARTTLTIRMLAVDGDPIVQWTFTGLYPVKWQIGSDAGPGVAIETLVLVYETVDVERVTRTP